MCLAEQPWMGHSLRRPDAAEYPDAIVGYGEDGRQLEDDDPIKEGATVVCRRLPGHTPLPYRGCLTEDDRIQAHCLNAEREWQASCRAVRAEARSAREELPKVPRGIPSTMLRLAATQEEQERAMQGPSGTLVVWSTEQLPECLCDNLLK